MATGSIPNLNTDNVSFLAHYQVSDDEIKTGESFNPEDLQFETDPDARLQPQSTDVYDNGIEMKVDDKFINDTITLRAGNKNHKWVTAHLKDYTNDNGGLFTSNGTDITDVSEFSYTSNKSDIVGEFGLMPWADYGNLYDSSQNSIFNLIKKGLSSSSFWNQSNLTLENSGIYNYTVSNNNQKTSIFGGHFDKYNSGESYGFSYTDSTTIHKAYLVGSCRITGDYVNVDVDMNGKRAYTMSNNGSRLYFSNNVTKIVDDKKQFEIDYYVNYDSDHRGLSAYFVIVWS